MRDKGNQPVVCAIGRTIAEAYHKTLKAVWEEGCEIATSFDHLGDPPSKDATVLVVVEDPFAEPRFSKVGWPGGPVELEIYRLEVLWGVHDHWVNRGGREWNYTYHERLFAWDCGDGRKVNQVETMIQQMVEAPDLYRRRFQVSTWIPSVDPFINDPPCLQRLHFRWLPGEGETWVLNMNSDWRSRDLFKAWFMNVVGIVEIQRYVALEVARRRGLKVKIGRYTDKSDSLHIYGSYFRDNETSGEPGVEKVLQRLAKQPLEKICFSPEELAETLLPSFEEARHLLAAQLAAEKDGLGKGVVAPDIDWHNFPYPAEWDL